MADLEKTEAQLYVSTKEALQIITPKVTRQRLSKIIHASRFKIKIIKRNGRVMICLSDLLRENERRKLLSQKLLNVKKIFNLKE